MTNFVGGQKGAVARTRPSPATALRIQSSLNGTPRPFGWGQSRIASNLVWYGNFAAEFVPASSGGKGAAGGGGGKGGPAGGAYSYSAGAIFGICEGPIDSVIQAWENKSPIVPSGPGFVAFDGDYQQLPWTWLATNYPAQAQAFRGLALEAIGSFALGTSPELPNMTWEVRFAISGALSESHTVPGSPYQVTASGYDWDYGIAGHYTVPYASPWQVTAQELVYNISGLATAIADNTVTWHASASAGVIWDVGAENGVAGTPLTKVSGTPATGQYAVSENTFTFAAADAGQPVVIITAALSPGVYYASQATATLVKGNPVVANLSTFAGVTVGARVYGSANVPEGAFVTAISGGSATGTVASGSSVISDVSGSFTATAGTAIMDAAGAIPPGTTATALTPTTITAAAASALTVPGDLFVASTGFYGGTLNGAVISGMSSVAGIAPGDAAVSVAYGDVGTVASVGASSVTLASSSGVSADNDQFEFVSTFTGDATLGSAVVTNVSALAAVSTAKAISDYAGAFPAPTSISAVAPGSITLSTTAGANAAADQLTFAQTATLSQAPTASGSGVTLTFRGAPLTQVLGAPGAAGEFSLSAQAGAFGVYGFNAADQGALVLVMDSPDANPADVLADFLTNPYYGMTQFPAARVGDLSVYRNYCLASGLLVSPTITTQGAANSFLQDLMKATNSEIVWSGGLMTVVPYGDADLSANGATYTAPSQPLYSLGDDDYLENQGSNARSVAASSSPDPVTVTRTDLADQENDIKLEYLDRANLYNPTIVEAKDDAAIALFGVKSSGSKQLHLFCTQDAALASAQLMLGRMQVLRTFSFTLDRKYILLDPMDLVSITDANAGLDDQWVRITEITENDDRSLSIVAEEYLRGTGAAPKYGHQSPQGAMQNYNAPAPDALAPIFFDAPVQLGNVLAMETILATNGSGPNWGGCDVWLSSDNVNFKYAGTLWGGTVMGTLTATFASGADPDTANTLSVDLTPSQGVLNGGTQADADQGNTLCLVDQELVTYEQATLTAQWKYDLGKHGASAGYLRRGFYGTTIASHAASAPFARLRPGSYFTVGYDAGDVGQTIHVKLLSFNPWGGGKQGLDQVSSYAHTLAAPPSVSTGLLAGVIQTPDMALNAATAQLTVSAAGPITLPASPSNATLVSGTLTTTGQLVQVAYNAQFTNNAASAVTVTWRVTYQGVVVLDSASIAIAPGVTATVAKQTTYTPGAQAGLFAFIAEMQTGVSPAATAGYVDLGVTELRR